MLAGRGTIGLLGSFVIGFFLSALYAGGRSE
jgi:hypothetical protein